MKCAAVLMLVLMPAQPSAWSPEGSHNRYAFASMEDCQKAIGSGAFQAGKEGGSIAAICRPPVDRDWEKPWGACQGLDR